MVIGGTIGWRTRSSIGSISLANDSVLFLFDDAGDQMRNSKVSAAAISQHQKVLDAWLEWNDLFLLGETLARLWVSPFLRRNYVLLTLMVSFHLRVLVFVPGDP